MTWYPRGGPAPIRCVKDEDATRSGSTGCCGPERVTDMAFMGGFGVCILRCSGTGDQLVHRRRGVGAGKLCSWTTSGNHFQHEIRAQRTAAVASGQRPCAALAARTARRASRSSRPPVQTIAAMTQFDTGLLAQFRMAKRSAFGREPAQRRTSTSRSLVRGTGTDELCRDYGGKSQAGSDRGIGAVWPGKVFKCTLAAVRRESAVYRRRPHRSTRRYTMPFTAIVSAAIHSG